LLAHIANTSSIIATCRSKPAILLPKIGSYAALLHLSAKGIKDDHAATRYHNIKVSIANIAAYIAGFNYHGFSGNTTARAITVVGKLQLETLATGAI
jgi:hypothetical protein